MGFLLSILYLITYYLTPVTVFGSLAEYRIELILAVLVAMVSLPSLMNSFVLKVPQSLALIGMALFFTISGFVGTGFSWWGSPSILGLLPECLCVLPPCGLHCNTKRRLQILVLMLLFISASVWSDEAMPNRCMELQPLQCKMEGTALPILWP